MITYEKGLQTAFYNANNANLTVYKDCEKLFRLAEMAYNNRILFHVEGMPFGYSPIISEVLEKRQEYAGSY